MAKRYIGKLIDAKLLPKNEEGFVCCRWCNGSVKPPKKTMCSPECVHEILIRTNTNYLRTCVYKRDKGICAICKIDTKEIAKNALLLVGEAKENFLKSYSISLKRKIWMKKHGGGLWDADHIVPVKDGGGLCGLDNLRTLCIKCHKSITSSFVKELAEKRKENQ
jgi:5-methylcytosine-specific restriction endonuclease McrA